MRDSAVNTARALGLGDRKDVIAAILGMDIARLLYLKCHSLELIGVDYNEASAEWTIKIADGIVGADVVLGKDWRFRHYAPRGGE